MENLQKLQQEVQGNQECHETEYATNTQTKELTLTSGDMAGAAKAHVLWQAMKIQWSPSKSPHGMFIA